MARSKLPDPRKDEWKTYLVEFEAAHGFRYKRKPRYLVDESLGVGAAILFKHAGRNVKYVDDVGLKGHPDENVFQFAQSDRRIIMSHDDDFMDNRLFPLRRCNGIAVFPFGD